MTSPDEQPATDYALGHTDDELERLNAQARLVGPFTRRFFEEAGLVEGMRVLDVGSGAGDVSLLARRIVGAAGEVVGFDLSERAVAAATARASALGYDNVGFHVGNPAEASFDRPFDAVIGRYVLMFQKDPAAMLHALSRHVRSGGIVVFHEAGCDDARSRPVVASYDQSWRWVIAALRPGDASIGLRLPAVFRAAGLPAPTMRLEALIGGGPECAGPVDLVVGLVSTLLPEIERRGIASRAEVAIATLGERMRTMATRTESVLIGRSEIGAWCRL